MTTKVIRKQTKKLAIKIVNITEGTKIFNITSDPLKGIVIGPSGSEVVEIPDERILELLIKKYSGIFSIRSVK